MKSFKVKKSLGRPAKIALIAAAAVLLAAGVTAGLYLSGIIGGKKYVPPQTFTVSGKVVHEDDVSYGIAGVKIYSADVYRTATDEDGTFSLRVKNGAQLRFVFDGLAFDTLTISGDKDVEVTARVAEGEEINRYIYFRDTGGNNIARAFEFAIGGKAYNNFSGFVEAPARTGRLLTISGQGVYSPAGKVAHMFAAGDGVNESSPLVVTLNYKEISTPLVVADPNGFPVAGAFVYCDGEPPLETDESGRTTLKLFSRFVTVRVTHPNFTFADKVVENGKAAEIAASACIGKADAAHPVVFKVDGEIISCFSNFGVVTATANSVTLTESFSSLHISYRKAGVYYYCSVRFSIISGTLKGSAGSYYDLTLYNPEAPSSGLYAGKNFISEGGACFTTDGNSSVRMALDPADRLFGGAYRSVNSLGQAVRVRPKAENQIIAVLKAVAFTVVFTASEQDIPWSELSYTAANDDYLYDETRRFEADTESGEPKVKLYLLTDWLPRLKFAVEGYRCAIASYDEITRIVYINIEKGGNRK